MTASFSIVQSKKNSNAGFWNYADSFTYTAAGAVSSMQFGNGKWESATFNSRLQPTHIALSTVQGGTDKKLDLVFGYGTTANNGNVLSQTITVPDTGQETGFEAVQDYEYDELNRLKSATEYIDESETPSWQQAFTFDRFGNRNFDEASTTTLPKDCGGSVCPGDRKVLNPTISATNNRIVLDQDADQTDDYEFDLSGNTTEDAQSRTFIYDAENKQIEVKDSSDNTIGKYFYDGDGKRVKKIEYSSNTPVQTTIFIYDASGKLVAEYETEVAQPSTAQVSYLTQDHLGSPRITTDKDGKVFSRRDFMPFGEEITSEHTPERDTNLNYGDDGIRQKFTGYERDDETNLDFAQARYFNYGHGRFSSPDSFTNDTRVSDPQSWNLYAYVRNNPLNLVDPMGKKAKIYYYYDKKSNTTVIIIRASFAVYKAKGQDISKQELNDFANDLKTSIEGAFSGEFEVNGRKFKVSSQIDVKVKKSERSAKNSNVDNILEVGNQDLVTATGDAAGGAFRVDGEDFDRAVIQLNKKTGGISDLLNTNTAIHEFGHLLGMDHNENDKRSSFYPKGGSQFLQEDWEKLINPPVPPPLVRPGDPVPLPKTILNATNSSTEERRVNTMPVEHPSQAYRWVQRVKE